MDFVVPADFKVKKLMESEKRDKYLDLARELKKLRNMKMTIIPIVICVFRRIGTETGGPGNKRTSEDHPNYSIVEIGQNTKKSPGNLRRLVVTQTLVENH